MSPVSKICLQAVRVALLAMISTIFYSLPIHAQLPQRLKPCSPYPTLADEIREMNEEVAAKTPRIKVVIEAVKFEDETHLPDSIRTELIESLKRREFDADGPWTGELEEVGIKGAWQNRGYFFANVKVRAQVLGGDAEHQRVLLTVRVDEGMQYRLGDIRFRRADDGPVLSPEVEELRKLIPLREGELFNVEKIRDAMRALTKLYGSRGYIDFTASPSTEVEEARGRISLTLELDEQTQFRVGNVEVVGLSPRMESLLRSILRPGEPFNSMVLEDFYKAHKTELPPNVRPEDVQINRDLRSGTVDLMFDFWTCPKPKD